ncbi:MAG: uncharacterized protein QG651_96 [Pseudomonadota bacterium]|jgi:uncharacterized protein YdcH (DUF465 family)|nr:uncharacterized protein [Pseudomonadota bacterium]
MRTPHQNLTDSFPHLKEAFHHLKTHDHHFQHLLKQYEELDTLVHKIDHEQEAMTDLELEKVKKERVILKDTLYTLMVKCKSELSL